jgi:hypothetical protein
MAVASQCTRLSARALKTCAAWYTLVMTIRLDDLSSSARVCSQRAGIVLLMSSVGCSLIGVEPDEIDLAMGSDTEAGASTNADSSFETGGTDTGPDDASGDGDGDPSDGDTGDGDGDPGGDGDGDPEADTPCEELGAVPLNLGPNDATIAAGPSVLMGSCGHPGPERVYSYTTDAAVDLELTLTADFDAALYAVVGSVCLPLVEDGCVNTPNALMVSLGVGETIYVIVDAATPDGGAGTLDVALAP